MLRSLVLVGWVSALLLPLGLLPRSGTTDAGAEAAPPDTVQSTIAGTTPLVRSLPDTVNGTPVTRYTLIEGPSLCGVAGFSFTWIVRDTASGTYHVPLQAAHTDAPPDTLVVRVTIQSE